VRRYTAVIPRFKVGFVGGDVADVLEEGGLGGVDDEVSEDV
jgi:hypothetical protein